MTQTEKSQTATTGGSLPGFDPKKKKGAAALPFIALDTETGGTRPGTHALLSIAAVASWRDEAFIVYIEPGNHLVDPAAARINGYTPELWDERGCLPLPAAMLMFKSWLAYRFREQPKAKMLAHNAGFDKAFLEEASALTLVELPVRHAWRCSMDKMGTLMDRGIIPDGNAKLDRLGELSGQWQPGQRPKIHDAAFDALAYLRGYQWLLEKEAEHTLQWITDGSLQDDELTVLVSTDSGVGEAFHEADVWRWTSGQQIEAHLHGWADLPVGCAS